MMLSSAWRAEIGMSIKVFMPFLNDKLSVLAFQVLCFGQFLRLETDRFTKNDLPLHLKDRFAAPILHMDMNPGVIVAVKEKAVSVLGENCRHRI